MESRLQYPRHAIWRSYVETARRLLRLENPNRPYLVSFPRSGSHFISVALERYCGGASPFSNFLGLGGRSLLIFRMHAGDFPSTHDLKLTEQFRNLVYLYRNPIDTLYSFLEYEGIAQTEANIRTQTNLWISHLEKWIFRESYSKKKLILCYENLIADFPAEFGKLLDFLGFPVDTDRVQNALDGASKEEIQRLTIKKDAKVIRNDPSYRNGREIFLRSFGSSILNSMPPQILALLEKDAQKTRVGSVAKLLNREAL